MNFYIPTQIFTETDCVKHHAGLLAGGGTKALLVTGRGSALKTGAYEDVTGALSEHGVDFCVFDRIEENPSVETVAEAAAFGLSQGADFVVGIGGGSPLDAAKAIALMMANPDKDSEILYKKCELSALPVYAVPTTAGTGSEATPYAILTLHNEKTKRGIAHRIFPAAAFADPKYLAFAPQQVLCNTAVDALGHIAESYFNTKATHYSRMLCEYALGLWRDGSPSSRSLASTMAGMAISHTGTSIPHGLSYFLTYEHGDAHGKAVGVFLVPYLRHVPAQDEVLHFLNLMGLSSLRELETLLLSMIGTASVAKEEETRYISSLLSNQAKLANCPYAADTAVLTDFFENNRLIALS